MHEHEFNLLLHPGEVTDGAIGSSSPLGACCLSISVRLQESCDLVVKSNWSMTLGLANVEQKGTRLVDLEESAKGCCCEALEKLSATGDLIMKGRNEQRGQAALSTLLVLLELVLAIVCRCGLLVAALNLIQDV